MSRISNVNVVREFTNDNVTSGIYSADFKGEQMIFIRNGDSVGAVQFYLGEPATKCISIIRDDVKQELFESLKS